MYSLVLAAMLTTGTSATPAWGCCGGGYSSCHGCHGCCGGGWFGGHHGHGCHGGWSCYGGCYSCYGCLGCYGGYGSYGSCYGGGYGWGGCSGCWGGYGGYGSGYGGWGCAGGGYGWACSGGCFGCYGSGNGWGCAGGYGGYMDYGGSVAPSGPAMQGAPGSKEPINPPTAKPGTGTGTGMAPARAQILVQLPTDAKLFVDDRPITLAVNRQAVVTPELEAGQDYYYIFRAEATRNGTPVEDTRRVVIRAGARVTVDFGDLATARAKTGTNLPLISAK